MISAFMRHKSGPAFPRPKLSQIVGATEWNVPLVRSVCLDRIADCLTTPEIHTLSNVSHTARAIWQPRLVSLLHSIIRLEQEASELSVIDKNEIISFVMSPSEGTPRDALRLVAVACDVARGQRCASFEQCSATLRSSSFLPSLLKHRPLTLPSAMRELHSAAIRRIDPSALPQSLRALHAFLAGLLRVAPKVSKAINFCTFVRQLPDA